MYMFTFPVTDTLKVFVTVGINAATLIRTIVKISTLAVAYWTVVVLQHAIHRIIVHMMSPKTIL